MTTSRIFFVASQEKQMPRVCSFLHMDLLTPIPAVIITVCKPKIVTISTVLIVLHIYRAHWSLQGKQSDEMIR